MKYKRLIWGILFFILSLFGWLVSVIFSVLTLGKFRLAANIFGYMAVASIPIAVVLYISDRPKK